MHAPVTHDDAVAHADGRHHHGGAAGGIDASLDSVCQLAQMGMAGDNVALGAHHADQRLLQFLFRKSGRVKK